MRPSPEPESGHNAIRHLKWLDWVAFLTYLYGVFMMLVGVLLLFMEFRTGPGLAFVRQVLALLVLVYGWLNFRMAKCLQKRRSRAFCLVLSALNCAGFPGLILGITTLILLSRPPVAEAFTATKE